MKRFALWGIGLLFLVLAFGGVYYFVVVLSSGTATIQYIEPNDRYHSFSDILRHPELQGKVVYVDFWHTGCTPCLEEFTHLPALKKKFHDRHDLAFLYLGKDRSVPGEKFR